MHTNGASMPRTRRMSIAYTGCTMHYASDAGPPSRPYVIMCNTRGLQRDVSTAYDTPLKVTRVRSSTCEVRIVRYSLNIHTRSRMYRDVANHVWCNMIEAFCQVPDVFKGLSVQRATPVPISKEVATQVCPAPPAPHVCVCLSECSMNAVCYPIGCSECV